MIAHYLPNYVGTNKSYCKRRYVHSINTKVCEISCEHRRNALNCKYLH